MTTPTCSKDAATRARVQHLLDDFFQRGTARAGAYGSQFQRLWQVAGRSVSGGKMMRPLLLINCYDSLTDGTTGPRPEPNGSRIDQVMDLAVALELLHYSFLLHDDVIDGDLLRRGRPNLIGSMLNDGEESLNDTSRSMHWAQTCGILMGDLLLSASHQIFARADLPTAQRNCLLDLLDETITDSVAGEHSDVGLSEAVISPELTTILDMTTRKTATYSFELPMRMAAVLAGASDGVERRLGEIGRHLGLGFQLQDDLLGAFGDPACHGKDHYSDLREGKQTAIIAAARVTGAWPSIEGLLGTAIFSHREATRVSDLLVECGAKARVAELAERELRSAAALLEEPGEEIPPTARTVLIDLADQLRGRCS
ncbi:polyprenyl synthetase family protein [Acidipropionibacterium thoenii]|uniref:polyprenyl synthetase family protein n=1 Tax=Acidipropionibacterium thoenii TaxID=1751 RepID=UPI00041EBBFE|nr:polyprenyl synthetase family protein [Acidipropionibacterium thoenii]